MEFKGLLTGLLLACNGNYIDQTNSQSKFEIDYTPEVINQIVYIYDEKTKEVPICQFGTRNGNKYIVDKIKVPIIIESTDSSAKFRASSCQKDKKYLGMLHNHFKKQPLPENIRCAPGDVDMRRFINDKHAKLESILCELNYPEYVKILTYFKAVIPKDIIDMYKQ